MERIQTVTKRLVIALSTIGALASVVGCGNTQSKATPQEQYNYEHPSKYPPPEARMGPPPTDATKGGGSQTSGPVNQGDKPADPTSAKKDPEPNKDSKPPPGG